jgi:uncharacterized protein
MRCLRTCWAFFHCSKPHFPDIANMASFARSAQPNRLSFYATRLSERQAETSEGYRICLGVVCGRTGWQTYSVSDLPQDEAAELGVDLSNQNAQIQLYRSPEAVFDPIFIASMSGKPVCWEHPSDFVNAENSRQLTRGHIQNPRKGDTPLESGDWPLVADLVITDADLIKAIDSGMRECSIGYEYRLARDGDKLLQTQLKANHLAIVPNGRAGPEARINDHALELAPNDFDHIEIPAAPKPDQRRPENKPKGVHMKGKEILKHVFGIGLKQYAADASPEEFAEAAFAAHRVTDSESESEEEKEKREAKDAEEKQRKEAEDKRMKDAAEAGDKAKDAEIESLKKRATDAESEVEKLKKEGEDRAARDAAEGEKQHFMPCKVKDCTTRDCRMSRALDEALKAHPEEDDADMNELAELIGSLKPQQADAQVGSEVIEPIADEEMDPAMVGDARANDAEFQWLKANRKKAIDSGDKKQQAAYNARHRAYYGTSQPGNGGYGAFAAGAGARGKDVGAGPGQQNAALEKLKAHYDSRLGKDIGTFPKEAVN